ncbi:MAG: efflux RND transporter periplasmic adaptor subunit, partial [Bdellovibrionales bacterium]|nr:efflux RND transporter periplasmic adaptor subunit [Bdellovibrionales bacterium]
VVATITDPTKLSVLIEATAADRAQLPVGIEGKFLLDGREYPARLEGMSPVVDPATGTSAGELSLKLTKGHTVVPGLVGAVEFSLRPRKAILVPEESIFYKSKETFLHIVDAGKIRRVPVQLGPRQKGQIQILEGISADQTYVVRSSRHLKAGEEPQVNKADPQ